VRRAPRSPFVVTLAVGAIGVGCSNSSSNSSANDSAIDDTAESGIVNPAGCPADDPGFGAKFQPCDLAPTTVCVYSDLCDRRPPDTGPPVNAYVCHDNGAGKHWVALVDYTPTCPPDQPKDGDPCPCSPHMILYGCTYACEGKSGTLSWCQTESEYGKTWYSTPVACNPPEPDGGLDADGAVDASDAGVIDSDAGESGD
jgi:hypothetical protein